MTLPLSVRTLLSRMIAERIVALEEARRVREVAFDAEDAGTQPAGRAAEDQLRRTVALLETVRKNVSAGERAADERHEEVVGPSLTRRTAQDDAATAVAVLAVRAVRFKARRFAGRSWRRSTSSHRRPRARTGAVKPSLLARRISVSRRFGHFHDQRRVARSRRRRTARRSARRCRPARTIRVRCGSGLPLANACDSAWTRVAGASRSQLSIRRDRTVRDRARSTRCLARNRCWAGASIGVPGRTAIDHAIGNRQLTEDVAVSREARGIEHRDIIGGRRAERLSRDRVDHRQQIEQFLCRAAADTLRARTLR